MSRPIHIRTFLILVAVVALGVIVGCGDSESESGGSESIDDTTSRMESMAPEELSGRTFVSTGVKGRTLVADTRITLGFDSGMLSASAGCNSIQGKYEINGGSFSLGKAAETLLGCPNELEDQDEWLTNVLQSGLRPYERDDTVVFLGLGVEIDAKESEGSASTPPVVGTDWLLNSYSDKLGNEVSMKPGVRLPSLEFKADDTVFVFDGCNTGSGKAEVGEDGTIKFGPIGLTRIACPGLSGDVSNAFLKVIDGKAAYEFEAQNLVISKQGKSLTFNPGN
ncbi:MAG: META domain-containing protein [Solirubrobacterales bacterium]